jgi:glycogen synthase
MEHEVDQDGLEEVDVQMLVSNIERAMGLLKAPAKLREMQVAAMEAATDFSWSNSVKQYVAEFKRIGVKTM